MHNFIKSLVALVSLPLFCGCQAVFFRTLNSSHAEIAPTTQVYAAEHDLRVDVYRPPHASGSTPVVLFFYGGSWRTGARGEYAFAGRALASRGVLTIIADYRKYPQGAFPRFEEDAASAARWTIDHVAQFGGDPTRVFLTGHSAGAQIATLLATDKRYLAAQRLRPADFAGAIGVAGPYDFLPLTDPKLIEVFGPESQWPASQPIRFVDGDEPPFLLLQGSGDRIVEPRNASAMETTLRAAHVPVTSRLYPGVGHFRILAGLRFTALAPTLDDIVAFIEATPPVQK